MRYTIAIHIKNYALACETSKKAFKISRTLKSFFSFTSNISIYIRIYIYQIYCWPLYGFVHLSQFAKKRKKKRWESDENTISQLFKDRFKFSPRNLRIIVIQRNAKYNHTTFHVFVIYFARWIAYIYCQASFESS